MYAYAFASHITVVEGGRGEKGTKCIAHDSLKRAGGAALPPNEAPRHQEVPEQPMHMKQLALNALQTLLMLPKATTELTDPTENTPLTASSANRPLTSSSDHAAFMA